MPYKKIVLSLLLPALIGGCTATGGFDTQKAVAIGASVVQAGTVTEAQVKQTASLAAKEMDGKSQVASASSAYGRRLSSMTRGLDSYQGLSLNFKVYVSDEVNAFAMPDGTIRVYSGLMDAMPDDQVLAVIGHEIGHVYLKHSYDQMRQQLLTNAAFQTAASVGGVVGGLTAGQLGQLAYTAVNARFSQSDELEADAFAVQALNKMGKDPYAMMRSIETLKAISGGGGGSILSTHPSNDKRITKIQTAIDAL